MNKDVSYISGNDKKYEISIHSNQKDQNYEFSCKDDVDYDMWLFHLKQAQKMYVSTISDSIKIVKKINKKKKK